jgi:serine/threonine protein kinase
MAGAGVSRRARRGAPPRAVGPYRILRQLGEGGFGVVYLAQEDWPPYREVALKILRPGLPTAEAIARFALERDALFSMDHSGIVRILDALSGRVLIGHRSGFGSSTPPMTSDSL